MGIGQPQIDAPSGENALPDGGILEQFVARALALTDARREALAERRRAIDESDYAASLRAGAEALATRGERYAAARRTLATAHVPDALEHPGLSPGERAHWNEVARLARLAIDEMLVAISGNEVLHPNHLRELSLAWGHRSDSAEPTSASTSSP